LRIFFDPRSSSPSSSTSRRRLVIAASAALLVGALSPAAHAAGTYPAKPVRIVVPFAPGGSGDVVMRLLTNRLSERMGQPFLVENRPGAGGANGAAVVARAAPDGYTLAFVSAGYAWLAALRSNLTFDPAKDLVPIGRICSIPYMFLTNADAPFKTVPEFVAYAKAHPDEVNLASAGVGTLTHLLPAWLFSETGVKANHVPYGGTAPAMNSLLAGETQLYFDPVATAMVQVRAGKVRALATTGTARSKTTENIPTLTELGYKVNGATWFGLMAPAGTPKPVIERLNQGLNAVLQEPDMQRRLHEMDFTVEPGSVAQFASFLKTETATWTKIVRDNGIQSD
jgi:tripartite-type tricarboxylate transporter receptor subunit TctC